MSILGCYTLWEHQIITAVGCFTQWEHHEMPAMRWRTSYDARTGPLFTIVIEHHETPTMYDCTPPKQHIIPALDCNTP